MNDQRAKSIGLKSAARINLCKAEAAIIESKCTLLAVREQIADAQKRKDTISKRLITLSRRGGRRYTKELHKMDSIVIFLKELQEDRLTAKYLIDQAKVCRLRCRDALTKVDD